MILKIGKYYSYGDKKSGYGLLIAIDREFYRYKWNWTDSWSSGYYDYSNPNEWNPSVKPIHQQLTIDI